MCAECHRVYGWFHPGLSIQQSGTDYHHLINHITLYYGYLLSVIKLP
ncbi:unnamed protein product [Rhodiola kirilowii]